MIRDEAPFLDLDQILAVLDRHLVEFLVVGGVTAIAYGAIRPTSDLDCVARRSGTNLDRLAAALRELNARLRIAGLSDKEAAALPTQLDRDTLARMEISTWRTDAGDLDVLIDIADRSGRRMGFDELIGRATVQDVKGRIARIAALDDVIASKERANRPKDREALPELRALRPPRS
ncbi:MAG: hypothetical protein ACT4OS_08285 [Acidimicrobiales bacterium]